MCELCFFKKAKIVHNKDGNHLNNKIENLQALCNRCHLVDVRKCIEHLPKDGSWSSRRRKKI